MFKDSGENIYKFLNGIKLYTESNSSIIFSPKFIIDNSKQDINGIQIFKNDNPSSDFILYKFHLFKSWLSHLNKFNQFERNKILIGLNLWQ